MSATGSTRCTPLRRAKSSRDAGVSPGRDGMLFAESVVTLTSASRLLQSLALRSLARTRRHHVGPMVGRDRTECSGASPPHGSEQRPEYELAAVLAIESVTA